MVSDNSWKTAMEYRDYKKPSESTKASKRREINLKTLLLSTKSRISP